MSVSSSVHVLTTHTWFQTIYLFRSAVVWSWWISLPRPRDLCLSELAVRWGPRLPWRVRWVFSHLWVERLFAFGFASMWNQMSVAFTDRCSSSWFYFYFLLNLSREMWNLLFLFSSKWVNGRMKCSCWVWSTLLQLCLCSETCREKETYNSNTGAVFCFVSCILDGGMYRRKIIKKINL